jgi:hypothetical protein
MDVRGQIFRRIEQPQKSFAAHARGRFSSPIPRRNLLVPGSLVVGPTISLIFASRITKNRQRCMFPPPGALTRANSASEKVGLSMKLPLSI